MPYTLDWHTPNIIIFAKMTGKYTEEEMFACNESIRDNYLAVGEAPVHLIIDITEITEYPRNLGVIQKASNIFQNHPSMGWMLLVGFSNPLTRFITNINLQIFGMHFRFSGTMEEALTALSKIDIRLGSPTDSGN